MCIIAKQNICVLKSIQNITPSMCMNVWLVTYISCMLYWCSGGNQYPVKHIGLHGKLNNTSARNVWHLPMCSLSSIVSACRQGSSWRWGVCSLRSGMSSCLSPPSSQSQPWNPLLWSLSVEWRTSWRHLWWEAARIILRQPRRKSVCHLRLSCW